MFNNYFGVMQQLLIPNCQSILFILTLCIKCYYIKFFESVSLSLLCIGRICRQWGCPLGFWDTTSGQALGLATGSQDSREHFTLHFRYPFTRVSINLLKYSQTVCGYYEYEYLLVFYFCAKIWLSQSLSYNVLDLHFV